MNSLKINMFTRNAYFQYSHRAVSVITAFTLVLSSFVFALPSIVSADTTVTLYPVSNGTHTSWENDWDDVDEISSFSCSSEDSIGAGENDVKESFNLDLSAIPDGSLITSIDVLTYSRDEDDGDNGQYRALVIFNGDETESSGSPISPASDSGCDGPNTKTFDVSDTVKSGATTLEIGVKKSNASASGDVRVGAIHAVVAYTEDVSPDSETIVVTGNTAAGENQPGWLFNRDTTTRTPFEFNSDEASVSSGSLFVLPIENDINGNSDKFIAENFLMTPIADIDSISYDFNIANGGEVADKDHFYLTVYARFGSSPSTKYYDCRYNMVPSVGTVGGFTTVTFDPTSTYSVTTHGTSPFPCPSSPSGMDGLSAGSAIRAIALNVGDTSGSDEDVSGYLDKVVVSKPTMITTYDFEPLACDASSFEAFILGSVHGQSGWTSSGSYDQEIVPNIYGFPTFGCKTLRISNAVTSGSFGDQTFSNSTANEAGESTAVNDGMSGGTRQSKFEAQFDFAVTQPEQQPGLFLSVSPDRGDGARMSYLGFTDSGAGIDVVFYDVQGTGDPANFVATTVATGLSRTAVHTAKFEMHFLEGPSNDVVKIYIDGGLVHTGTSWENYFRFDDESQGAPHDVDLENKSRTVDSLLFRAGGTAAPTTWGKGYLIDNLVMSSGESELIDTTSPDMPVHLWPEDGAVMPSPFLTHIDWTDVTDVSEPVVYYYESAFSSATSTGTYGDDFTSPIYQSGTLAVSEIPTLGTGEGTYFWHVRAVDDEGNSTPWTAPWSVVVDNTPPDVTVTIVKYIDDEHATAESVDSASFPMYAIYPGGEGNYSLTTSGFNNPNPYEATTSNMPWGSDYSTYEVTSAEGPVYPIGEDCPIDSYRLVGYKTGNTLEQAEADDISTDVPVFEGLMKSKYVIVVNEPCTLGTSEIIQPTESEETSGTTELEAYYADENGDGNDGVQWAVRAGTCAANTGTVFGNVDGKNTPFTWDGTNFNTTIDTTQVLNGSYCFVFNPTEDDGNTNQRLTRLFSINNPLPDVKVHIYKYLQGDETTEQVPDDFEPATTFPMQASWDAENIGAGSGAYVLGNNHGGAALKYAADTSAMTSGADYSTYEDTYPGNGSSNVLAPTESCQVGYYKLVGYQSSTTSLEDAEEASISTVAPSFTGLESDAYVIVVNKYCGDEPEVTYADEVKMCKVDQNGDELSGWTLYLKGDTVETLNVNSNSWMGADSSVLDDYTSYLAFASGTWANQGGANLVDAEYSTTDSWTSYMDGYTGYGNDILDLQLNEGFINWGSYNSDHSYVYGFTPIIDDSVNFRVFDGTGGVQNEGWFNDNTGSLSVEIAKGFIGETDEETGCVTFENVPYGSYTVGEILQDGWTNVTEEDGTVAVGDTVVVEGSEQVFTLMNDNGEEEPVYGSITIVKSTGEDGEGTFTFTSEELGVEGEFTITTEEGIGQETFTNLLAGTYTVDELVPEGWNLDDAFCDDDDSGIPSIVLSEGENVTCTFENSVEEVEEGGGDDGPPVETFSTFGGGNGPVVGSFGAVLGASTGQVLGASTGGLPELPNGCSALVSTYMRRGMNNDPEQVKLLQSFLNGEMGLSLPLTGFFGLLTENAVKAFQLKYAEQILAPWGITQPTGYVYKTTQRWINLSHCSSLNIPMPDLSN